jgi:aconitate hydratase
VFSGNETWNSIQGSNHELFDWQADSTYIQEPPFFEDLSPEAPLLEDIQDARVLVALGDSITTDHISPAGSFSSDSPAGKYLMEAGVSPRDFNSYGSRRGNDNVMTRGTFANIRLRNRLVPEIEGGYSVHFPGEEQMTIFEAAEKYRMESVPLIVLAGKEYGTGSSRDWAAKGTRLLGVRAVIAESFERIHRSNLIGMGVLPLQFKPGEGVDALGLEGSESYTIEGLRNLRSPKGEMSVKAVKGDGSLVDFKVDVRLETAMEVTYYQNGGILQTVLRNIFKD